jgi:multidrug efflux pump subunit AcrA (membrane-fusion protein)
MGTARGNTAFSLIALVAGLGSAATHGQQVSTAASEETAARAAAMPVHEVKPGKLMVVVEARGSVEVARKSEVYSAVEAQTTILSLASEGQRVRIGDLVCELDSTALRDQFSNQEIAEQRAAAAYRNAKLAREVAEIAVTEYEQGVYKQEQYALKSQIAGAEAAIEKAADRLERTRLARDAMKEAAKDGAGKKAKSPADILAELDIVDRLETAEGTVATERKALELAKSKLEVLEKYTREKMTKALKVEAERKRTDELARNEAWTLEKSKAEKLRRQIAACKIVAPSDGVVVYGNDPLRGARMPRIEEGAAVHQRQKIVSILDLAGPMQVNVKVHESKVDQVAKGLPARVTVDGVTASPLSGKVESVAVLPDPHAMAAWDPKVYTTRIKLDEPLAGLRPGQPAQAEILVHELDNVLAVPLQAVVHFYGNDRVAVRKAGGGFAWHPVRTGQSNRQSIEIKQGISAGDLVATSPLDLMTEEQKRQNRNGATGPRTGE